VLNGWYTWLAQGLGKCLQPGERLYAEIRATDNPPATIPAEILVSSACQYIVIVGQSEIILIELTVPYNSPDCLQNARLRKENKELYQHALNDLEAKGMVL